MSCSHHINCMNLTMWMVQHILYSILKNIFAELSALSVYLAQTNDATVPEMVTSFRRSKFTVWLPVYNTVD